MPHKRAIGIPMTGLKRDGLTKAERTERTKLRRIRKHLLRGCFHGRFHDDAALDRFMKLGGMARLDALLRG